MKHTILLVFVLNVGLFQSSCAQQPNNPQSATKRKAEITTTNTPEPQGQVVDIDVDQFKQMMQQPEVVILDVRTPQEVAQSKISDQIVNIDVTNKPLFEQEIEKLDKDKTYLVYCRSGHRSSIAAQELARRGFKKVYNLKGGILAWQQAQNGQ